MKEYNLNYSVNFFRWTNLYSETTGRVDAEMVYRIIDRLNNFLNED